MGWKWSSGPMLCVVLCASHALAVGPETMPASNWTPVAGTDWHFRPTEDGGPQWESALLADTATRPTIRSAPFVLTGTGGEAAFYVEMDGGPGGAIVNWRLFRAGVLVAEAEGNREAYDDLFADEVTDGTYYLEIQPTAAGGVWQALQFAELRVWVNGGGTSEDTQIDFEEPPPAEVATPTFSPGAGTYTSSQTVSIACATSGATIRYTVDGSTPSSSSTAYSGPITVAESKTIKAKAFKAGMSDSAVASAAYVISAPSQVATPTFSPGAGTYTGSRTVTMACATSGATIRFTVDGTTPSSSSAMYVVGVLVESDTTIKAKAFKSGLTDSAVASADYVIQASSVPVPTITPNGGTFAGDVSVSIGGSNATYTIFRTIDGSDPLTSGTASSNDSIFLMSSAVVKARKRHDASGEWSALVSASFTVTNSTPPTPPTFAPNGGVYTSAQSCVLTAQAGTFIRYTVDGSNPTSIVGTLYAGEFAVPTTRTIKAIAVRGADAAVSSVSSATFTIDTPGVSVSFDPASGGDCLASGTVITATTSTAVQQLAYWPVGQGTPTAVEGDTVWMGAGSDRWFHGLFASPDPSELTNATTFTHTISSGDTVDGWIAPYVGDPRLGSPVEIQLVGDPVRVTWCGDGACYQPSSTLGVRKCPDEDGDGLPDVVEEFWNTTPGNGDYSFNLTVAMSDSVDLDQDGVPDRWELIAALCDSEVCQCTNEDVLADQQLAGGTALEIVTGLTHPKAWYDSDNNNELDADVLACDNNSQTGHCCNCCCSQCTTWQTPSNGSWSPPSPRTQTPQELEAPGGSVSFLNSLLGRQSWSWEGDGALVIDFNFLFLPYFPWRYTFNSSELSQSLPYHYGLVEAIRIPFRLLCQWYLGSWFTSLVFSRLKWVIS